MLLRLAYLGATNAFAMLRLLPMSDREKDVEILALRHQIAVLEQHLNGQQVRFHGSDRAFLASLLHGLPREVLRGMRLLVRPDTVLRRAVATAPSLSLTRPRCDQRLFAKNLHVTGHGWSFRHPQDPLTLVAKSGRGNVGQ